MSFGVTHLFCFQETKSSDYLSMALRNQMSDPKQKLQNFLFFMEEEVWKLKKCVWECSEAKKAFDYGGNAEREQHKEIASADDLVLMVTNRVWSHLKDPYISSISIWGWDGIGKSIIANKIMEEAKKGEGRFDVVAAVSVPQSYIDRPYPYPTVNVPYMTIQRMVHTPSSLDIGLVDPNFDVSHEPILEELQGILKKPSERKLREFEDKSLNKAMQQRRPTYQKLMLLNNMFSMTMKKYEEMKRSILSIFWSKKQSSLSELLRTINKEREEAAKELLVEIRRQTEELLRESGEVGQEASAGNKKTELEKDVQRVREEAEREMNEERRKELIDRQRELEKEVQRIKLEKELQLMESEKELQRQREEERTELEKEVQRVREEAERELNEEKRRELNERQRELEELVQKLNEENESRLQEARLKARAEGQKELRQRELQAKIVAELKIHVGHFGPTGVTNILSDWLARRRFLLVLKDVWEYIDLQELGVPLSTPGNGSKVIIIPTSEGVYGPKDAKVIRADLSSLSEYQAWQLLNAEAMDAATTLPLYPNIITSSSSIFECFSYCSLFPRGTSIDGSSLKEFWTSEGFLDELTTRLRIAEGEEEEERVEELMDVMVDALLMQLSNRCMLNSSQGRFLMPDGARQVVSSRKGLLIRCDSYLKQLPDSKQWEGAERISLSHNQINEPPTPFSPPNCPTVLTLFLNNNKSLKSIPNNFFENMTSLQVLDLSSTSINSLPSSISRLHKLRMLKLRSCSKLVDLPPFLKDMQKLEILDLHRTPLERITLDGVPSLRCLKISGAANLIQLSVNGCQSLSILDGLKQLSKLAALDLSGTKIKELPQEIFNMTSLKRLDLLRMKHLKRIPWKHITRFPEQLHWHQCGSYSLKDQFQDSNRFLISASDATLFEFLDSNSELSKSRLQNFYFLVCPCEARPKDIYTNFKTSGFPYHHVYAKHCISARLDRFLRCQRCMEICGGKTSINGIRGILSMADSFHLRGNEFINTVFDLGLKMGSLRECKIEKCRQLECVIDLGGGGQAANDIMGRLENLWLSDLPKLKTVCKGIPGNTSSACLKHLYLECCPKLISFFSASIRFPELELLEIKFCRGLENVCGEDRVAGQDVFPQLAELCLWELGKLQRICNGYLPMLKRLKTGGCPMLGKLPLLNKAASATKVEIEGETEWWESIRWEDGIKPHNISFKARRSFKA